VLASDFIFSDENMMDPYNLAICFGPTLVPIPEDRDQVQYQNLVNELIKNFIIFHEDIFPASVQGMTSKPLRCRIVCLNL
jgi:SLIT-ROBO Rho GTPase activating protein